MFRNSPWKGACLALGLALVWLHAARADEAAQRLIEAGREQFTRVRQLQTAAAGATQNEDRFFNARSCAECHHLGGLGGAGPKADNVLLLPDATVLHRHGTSPAYAPWRLEQLEKFAPAHPEVEAKMRAAVLRAKESNEKRIFVCGTTCRGPGLDERNTPALFGLGRIASIPQSTLDAIAEAQPIDLRGRSPRLRSGGLGRFGWKAQTATLADFNENACAAELGLKTERFTPAQRTSHHRRSPDTRGVPRAAWPKVDMTSDDLAALTSFVASLPEPVQVVELKGNNDVAAGARHFDSIGCAVCHVPDVGDVKGLYSDLLLHQVGTSGGGFYSGLAPVDPSKPFDIVLSDEMRTPPLWGVADSGPYLHDGSAATLDAAILRHEEQGAVSRERYQMKLNDDERKQVIAFLESLRAPNAQPVPTKIAAAP